MWHIGLFKTTFSIFFLLNERLSHLIALDLDELLEPVHDEDVAALVVVGNVAGIKPTILNCLGGRLLVV